MNRSQLDALLAAKITSGDSSTTAEDVRDFESEMIESSVNKEDDADSEGGFMQITSGRVDVSFVNSATPLGYVLRDNGTWSAITWDEISGYPDLSESLGAFIASRQNLIPLFNSYATVGNVTTGETFLVANTISSTYIANDGDKIEFEYAGSFVSSGTATRKLKVYYSGVEIYNSGDLSVATNASWVIRGTLIRSTSSTVRYAITMLTEIAALSPPSVGELSLTASRVLRMSGQAAGVGAATNDILLKLSQVNYIKTA